MISSVSTQYINVTDGQTDAQTLHHSIYLALHIATRGKNVGPTKAILTKFEVDAAVY